MPYIDGQRVTMEAWAKAHPLHNPFESNGETPEEEPVPVADSDAPPKRTPSKARQAKAAILAATGVTADSLDEKHAEPVGVFGRIQVGTGKVLPDVAALDNDTVVEPKEEEPVGE